MLAIRLQRTGRKGHAQFRIVVQDSRRTPTSGNIVYQLGHYNPHTKEVSVEKEKAEYYLGNGAQPSDRVTFLFQKEGLKLPSWVNVKSKDGQRAIKNPDKLRRNRPAEPAKEPDAPEIEVAQAETTEFETAEKATPDSGDSDSTTSSTTEEPKVEEAPTEKHDEAETTEKEVIDEKATSETPNDEQAEAEAVETTSKEEAEVQPAEPKKD